MLLLLFKSSYKKVSLSLNKKITDVSDVIDNISKRKKFIDDEMEALTKSVQDAESTAKKIVEDAKAEAANILAKSEEKIRALIILKEKEHQDAVLQIKNRLILELKNKMIDLATQSSTKLLLKSQEDRNLQNINIENSTDMLAQLAEIYDASKLKK